MARAVVVLALVGMALVPEASEAHPSQESDPADSEDRAAAAGVIDLDIDVLRAEDADVEQAFTDVTENVATQRAALAGAEQAVASAQAALEAAQGAVAATQAEIDVLVARSDAVVVEAFISPPGESSLEALTAETAGDATVKQTVLDMEADSAAAVLADLEVAQNQLEEQQEAEEEAANAQADAVADAEAALASVQAATSQAAEFVNAVEARLDHSLSEIEALRESDPELAEELSARAAQLAQQINAARADAALEEAGVEAADPSAPDGPVTITVEGGVASVSCPQGGAIEVAGVLARDLQGLLNLASQQGLAMCGTGWRDPAEQIALRRAHCGTSDYAVYHAPSSACSPPTARPGTSMHEQGLAIDFRCGGSTVRSGDACYTFLRNNAASFGLYNLPGEPWHWSTDGT